MFFVALFKTNHIFIFEYFLYYSTYFSFLRYAANKDNFLGITLKEMDLLDIFCNKNLRSNFILFSQFLTKKFNF